ncbi:unnamed protein product [Urochloa decumbens]|uniref:C3H1-type domain-containing protein n=1 Tax=Urochloa decumbens TaxID=240449 RepID=A0ABC8ZBQ8_9POAL
MSRTASDRARGGLAEHAPRPKCRSGRAAGLSPSDPIPTATAPSPNNSLTASSCLASARRLLASRHKSTAFSHPAAARITLLEEIEIGFGAVGSEDMERDEGAAAAAAGAARACRWEASLDGVIVLPAGSAAPRPQHARQQREREAEREREQESNPGAVGVFVGEPPEKVFYKTRLCEKFEAGKCSYEDGCTFAHGQAELRPPMPGPHALVFKRRTPPPPPPAPPSSQPAAAAEGPGPFGGYYGAKVCFEFRDKGTCHYGDRCAYAHASAAEVAEMRYPGGPRSVEHALRNAPPYARAAFAPGGAARSCSSTSSYAPAAAARAYPSAPPVPIGEDGRKLSRLELLSRKKMSGIYGDWPEEN